MSKRTTKEHKLELARARDKRYRLRHPEKARRLRRLRVKKWRALNPAANASASKKSAAKQILKPQTRIASNLRRRLLRALKNRQKTGSAVQDLGCTLDEFRAHIESKFSGGMTWANYGHKGWHFDHVRPLSSFNLSVREQLLAACHYTNIQPMWAVENYTKGKRYV